MDRVNKEQLGAGGSPFGHPFLLYGCIEEQSMNLSEDVNNSPTDPISRTDAVIVALSHPDCRTIENDSFQIS